MVRLAHDNPGSARASVSDLSNATGSVSARVAAGPACVVGFGPMPPLDSLADEWRNLQSRAHGSFFTSWTWIGRWLASLPADIPRALLRVEAAGRVVGLAVVCNRVQKRRALFGSSRVLYVNCTGDASLDELTIEYNGLLTEAGLEQAVLVAAMKHLAQDRGWDEIYLNGWERVDLLDSCMALETGTRLVERSRRPCHRVNLQTLRESGLSYIESPPRKICHKLGRVLREAQRAGGHTLDIAADEAQASEYLRELVWLHQQSWVERGQKGAFANPFLHAFHAELVADPASLGAVQLARVRVGGTAVGYVYNFIHRSHVYNYQSGFDYGFSSGAGWRPGVMCHALVIELNRRLGMTVYDLLAGDQAYKRELGTESTHLAWMTLQRDRRKFRLEAALRALHATCVATWQRCVRRARES